MKDNLDPRITISPELIAPCGMNCAVCMGRLLREENQCPGCRANGVKKPGNCARCVVINCERLKDSSSGYCSDDCSKFPCRRLQDLDHRYRVKYSVSTLANLQAIQELGISAFVDSEQDRWTCKSCGGIICIHRGYCVVCGA